MTRLGTLNIAAIILLLIGSIGATAAEGHGGWKLESEKDGIRIYTREIYGSGLKQVRAVAELKAPMEAILQVLTDYDNYKLWMNNVRESYVMDRPQDSVSFVYSYEDSPWPVQNRYRVDKMRLALGDVVSTLFFQSIPDYIQDPKDAIEAEHYEGWWKVSKMETGGCEVEYMLDGNPGGYIPSWLVNYLAIDAPYKTLANLRNRVSTVQRS